MVYFADLTEYNYLPYDSESPAYNIGWLDPAHEFQRWRAPTEFCQLLLYLTITANVHPTRGWHSFEFCAVERDGGDDRRSSYEIRVVGEDGQVFLAPALIHHYVVAHGYRPPDVFVEAVHFQ